MEVRIGVGNLMGGLGDSVNSSVNRAIISSQAPLQPPETNESVAIYLIPRISTTGHVVTRC